MGAFDTYSAVVTCPQCGDQHWIDGQTKLFDPGSNETRAFEPGVPCAASFGPSDLDRIVGDGWWRLREPKGDGSKFTLLVDLEDMYRCDCGLPLALLLHFELAPGTVTMTELEVLDARTELASRIDLVDTDPLWTGTIEEFRVALVQHRARPFGERAAVLRGWLAARFGEDGEGVTGGSDARSDPWTTLIGQMKCEACGLARERARQTLLTHPDHAVSFFGPAWTGGVVFLGDRIPFDDSWLAADTDRGWYFRARHPVGDPLSILMQRARFGCRCGAGRYHLLARFARRPGAVELVELALRVVRSRADLADVDFIEGQLRRPPRAPDVRFTREELLAKLAP